MELFFESIKNPIFDSIKKRKTQLRKRKNIKIGKICFLQSSNPIKKDPNGSKLTKVFLYIRVMAIEAFRIMNFPIIIM